MKEKQCWPWSLRREPPASCWEKVGTISLSRENRDEILAFLDGKTDTLDLHPWQKGGALVDVYWRKGDGFMMARYFDYAEFLDGVEYPLKTVSPQQVTVLESFAIDQE